jgi:hypothetical protein
LGVLLAPSDLQSAEHYLACYHGLRAHSLRATIGAAHQPRRLVAHERYADGRIQAARGNARVARHLLEEAYQLFDATGQRFRAALAARALYDLTGEEGWNSLSQVLPRTHKGIFTQA